jgi:hypothetical protein
VQTEEVGKEISKLVTCVPTMKKIRVLKKIFLNIQLLLR